MEWVSGTAQWKESNWQELPTTSHLDYYDLNSAQASGTIDTFPPQKDGTANFALEGIGSRLMMAFLQDVPDSENIFDFIWTCQTVGLEGTSGTYDGDETGSGVDRTGVQWFKLKVTSGGSLDSSSIVTDRVFDARSAASDPYWYYYPSLAANPDGDMLMGFSGSRSGEFIGAFYTGRRADGTTSAQPSLVEAGRGIFEDIRWGDYSATTLDPNDGTSFWTVQEYAEQASSSNNIDYGTWILEITPAP
jgi:hypothetical protein